jgi:GntR family transcriptional regulator
MKDMQLWFNRASEVNIREQLVTQVILGILSGDLAPGQRLPSTRELARRFKLHPNTASAGYRQLESEGWLESRRGSGVFVRAGKAGARPSGGHTLDQLISDLFTSARELGIPSARVHARLRERLDQPPPDHFLLIEPDEELREIVAGSV